MHKGDKPDESRAARLIVKDYIHGKLLYCTPPPEFEDQIRLYPEENPARGIGDLNIEIDESHTGWAASFEPSILEELMAQEAQMLQESESKEFVLEPLSLREREEDSEDGNEKEDENEINSNENASENNHPDQGNRACLF